MKKFIDWSSKSYKPGDKFGRLTILETVKVFNTYRYYALCQCACGSEPKYIMCNSIRTGHTTSCGCAHREAITTHNLWHSPMFTVHKNMLSRCYNPKDKRYDSYGARGITVCERWLNILNFIEDMEPTFQKGLTIDRIDNDKGYFPDNCRWATRKEQNRHYRRNLNYTHNGKTLCLKEWSELLSIPYNRLWDRIRVEKWSFEKAITTPKLL